MKNYFISKFILEGIKRDLKEDAQKRYITGFKSEKSLKNNIKKYINSNTNYIMEICKKIVYKKIQKNISFISKNAVDKIYKNTDIIDNEYILKNENILKHEKNINSLLFDILSNSKKAYKKYNIYNEIEETKENKKELYSFYISKSKSYKIKSGTEDEETKTIYNHDNTGAIEMFEDLSQTAVCELIANKKYIFLKLNDKILITKKAYYSILQAIDNTIKKTQRNENTQASYEDLQERKILDYLLYKNETENTENTNKKEVIKKMFDDIDFTPAQKNILNLINKTGLCDKDIYNNLNITKQGYYKHLRKIKEKCMNYIKSNQLENIYNIA